MSLDIGLYIMVDVGRGPDSLEKIALFDANITHNLNKMADEAGIYKYVWRPEELNIECANDLIEPLRAGIAKMEADPDHYKTFDAENGWGTYSDFLPWLRKYLAACEQYPGAMIWTWR